MERVMDRHNKPYLLLLLCAVAMAMLTACEPTQDMQGMDPRDYYTQHPIENTIENKSVTQKLRFEGDSSRLDDGQVARLRRALRNVSPMASSGVMVQLAAADKNAPAREKHLLAVLRSMGYTKDKINFESSEVLALNAVRIDVQYAAVVPPDCPDWRRNPVTTYSNTTQGNFGCASTVNLGAMVADPNDLVRGSASVAPDTRRSVGIVERYHAGQGASESSAASGSDGGSSGGDSGSEGMSGLSEGSGQ